MKLIIILFFILSISKNCYSQDVILKDLDNDTIKDEILFDRTNSQIICKLSSQNLIPIKSKKLEDISDVAGIKLTKNGFQFYNHIMRSGYYCQFRYNTKQKKIELIGMSRYNLGDAQRNGIGQSSVNLLTNKYVGDWSRFDIKSKKEIKIPTVTKPYIIKKVYLEEFSLKQPDDFIEFCYNQTLSQYE